MWSRTNRNTPKNVIEDVIAHSILISNPLNKQMLANKLY